MSNHIPHPQRRGPATVIAVLALCAALAAARAAEAVSPDASDDDRRGATHMGLAAREFGHGPLMSLIDRGGDDDGLSRLGLDVRGYAEVGYSYDFRGNGHVPYFGRVFTDQRGNHVQLDQVNLTLERRANQGGGRIDVGGRFELIYGSDTYSFHANGMDFYGDGGGINGPDPTPFLQFDPTQLYVDVAFPVGRGLLVRAGKFVTLLGAESIDPTESPFYSRSYLFGFAKPFTHAGVMANYRLDEAGKWDVWAGVVRGWDQASDDENDGVSFTGRVRYRPDEKTEVRVAAITGPEQPTCCGGGDDDWRTVGDVVVAHEVTEKLTVAAEGLYGFDGSADVNGHSADWYGAALYARYQFTPRVAAGLRGEWFHDGDGTRLGTEQDLDVYEATAGLTITPFAGNRLWSNLAIRPEVRYDRAEDPEFDGGRRREQWTVGVDVLLDY